LTLWVGQGAEELGLIWSYRTDLFDERTIERMHAHYRTLLESIVKEPDARLSTLEMRTEAERQEQELKDQKIFETNRRRFLGKRPSAVTAAPGEG
jgi:non-ribosomal peptide synthetase component F